MPEGLLAHLRYPQRLFEIQVRQYAKYHMTVPQVFYNDEDLWTMPREKYGGGHSHGAVLCPASPAGRGAARVHADDADDPGQSRQHDRVDGGALGGPITATCSSSSCPRSA